MERALEPVWRIVSKRGHR